MLVSGFFCISYSPARDSLAMLLPWGPGTELRWGTIDDREILMLDDVRGRSGMGIKGQGNKMCHLTPATGQRSTGVESFLGGLFFLAI